MITKTLTVTSEVNPVPVTFNTKLQELIEIECVYFRISGLDFSASAPPGHLLLRVDDFINPSEGVSITGTSSGNFVNPNSFTVPLHFEIGNRYNNGIDPDTQYGTVWGYQEDDMRWKCQNLGTVHSMRVSILDVRGVPFVLPLGSVLQLSFKVKYDCERRKIVRQLPE